jgi:hypothetical protein
MCARSGNGIVPYGTEALGVIASKKVTSPAMKSTAAPRPAISDYVDQEGFHRARHGRPNGAA